MTNQMCSTFCNAKDHRVTNRGVGPWFYVRLKSGSPSGAIHACKSDVFDLRGCFPRSEDGEEMAEADREFLS